MSIEPLKTPGLKSRLWLAQIVALTVLLSAGSAHGQFPTESMVDEAAQFIPELTPVELAREHFQRGVQLYRSGASDAALAEFTRAYQIAPNYRVLYNLAQVQAQRQQYVEALDLFRRYREEASKPLSPRRLHLVEAAEEELQSLVGRLFLTVRSAAGDELSADTLKGGLLYVDGLLLGSLQTEGGRLLNAGVHQIRVNAPDFQPLSQRVTLVGGEDVSLTLELEAVPGPPPEPEVVLLEPLEPAVEPIVVQPAPVAKRNSRWFSLGVTGALVGATTVLGVATRSSQKSLDRQLRRIPVDGPSTEDARSRLRNLALATDVAGLCALVGVGLTTYLFATAPGSKPSGAERVMVQVHPKTAGWSVAWSGQF